MRILLVAEDVPAARLLRDQLAAADDLQAELHWVHTLGEALLALQRPVDVVLLDAALSATGSTSPRPHATLRTLRQATHDAALVLLGACSDGGSEIEALRAGADDSLSTTQGSGGTLVRALRCAFERRRATLAERDSLIAAGIAPWAAVALESTRLFEEREQAVQQREDLLAVVSHDLRNPLNVITQAAALMAMSEQPTERARCEQHIKRAVSRMNRLIGDLLDDAAIERGTLTLQRQPLDPGELAREAFAVANACIDARHYIEVKVDPALPDVDVDGDRVQQVLCNLLRNAARQSPAGGKLSILVEQASAGVRFSVSDEGPGVPEAEAPHLFERFYKGADGQRDGAGLGLSIARGIVEAHGGQLWLEPPSGGPGAVFCFTLPVASIASQPMATPPAVARYSG